MFKVQQVKLDDSLVTLDHLGDHELSDWMHSNYGKYATLKVTHESTRKAVTYTDDGQRWDVIKQENVA